MLPGTRLLFAERSGTERHFDEVLLIFRVINRRNVMIFSKYLLHVS